MLGHVILTVVIAVIVFVFSPTWAPKNDENSTKWLFRTIVIMGACIIIGNTILIASKTKSDDIELTTQQTELSSVEDTTFLSSAHIAYDKINFGIEKDEYNKLMPSMFHKVGNEEYMFHARYNSDGKLYLLQLDTTPKTANYIETDLYNYADNLMAVISKKYGAPIDAGRPSIFEFQPDRIIWQYAWKLHTKRITIGYKEDPSGSRYNMIAWIYDENMMDDLSNQRNQREADNVLNDSNKF